MAWFITILCSPLLGRSQLVLPANLNGVADLLKIQRLKEFKDYCKVPMNI